jgi:ubiquinone/menaquinone biosynthesis C-methylase UbiE
MPKLYSSQRGLQLSSLQWLLDHHQTKAGDRRRMVSDLQLQKGNLVLDLGCGPGLWTSMFAEKVAPTGCVVGLDFSPELIDYAVSRLADNPLRDVTHFVLGNFLKLPFRDRVFDAVFLGNCLSYVSNVPSLIQGMKRVTRVGGRVISKEFDGGAVIVHPIEAHLTTKVLQAAARALSEEPSVPQFDNFVGRKMHGFFLRARFQDVTTTACAIQKVSPLSAEARRYITGNAEWYGKTAAPYLSTEDRRRWQAAFDPAADEYILDRDDFYFCMIEMVTVGIV